MIKTIWKPDSEELKTMAEEHMNMLKNMYESFRKIDSVRDSVLYSVMYYQKDANSDIDMAVMSHSSFVSSKIFVAYSYCIGEYIKHYGGLSTMCDEDSKKIEKVDDNALKESKIFNASKYQEFVKKYSGKRYVVAALMFYTKKGEPNITNVGLGIGTYVPLKMFFDGINPIYTALVAPICDAEVIELIAQRVCDFGGVSKNDAESIKKAMKITEQEVAKAKIRFNLDDEDTKMFI